MTAYDQTLVSLKAAPRKWLVTGAAGFIGSNLATALLEAGQSVVGLDNLATGKRPNLDALQAQGRDRFTFIEEDIRSVETWNQACQGVDCIFHEAAQVSVPASMNDPVTTHDINVTGFLHLLLAARRHRVRRIVYASSCAIYGDSTALPLTEATPGQPLSPYAASKLADEIYAAAFSRNDGVECVGLRYFNVFGPRQDPKGVYAAVIPLWADAMIRNQPVQIFGDGSTSRDFCYIANVVQANLLAATAPLSQSRHEVFNVAVGARTTLNELFELLRSNLASEHPHLRDFKPVYRDFRAGDILHSHADITKARQLLGYNPTHAVAQGLRETLEWFTKSPPQQGC
jgi:UDP-N-acetylglucosamine 4-epimerase